MQLGKSNDYSTAFYHDLERTSFDSAIEVLSIAFSLFEIKSVIDFGCGTGSWLRAAGQLGATKLTGLEGNWVRSDMLVDPRIEFITTELEASAGPPAIYDLAISVEVAEHLSSRRADGFVDDLCAASSRVLFSAAIPGQGGTGHINEQWQSYWARKFLANGYLPLDVIRPQLYGRKSINTWYRNNTILYIKNDDYIPVVQRILNEGRLSLTNLDFVIPDVYENPGLRNSIRILRKLPQKFANAVRWRLRIGRWHP